MLNVGLIGFGSISRVHRKAYADLEKLGVARLVCAYDVEAGAFTKNVLNNLDTTAEKIEENIRFYTDLDEMLNKESLDFVDICIPSYLHAKMSCELLGRGYNVLCEKPMALSYADCREMICTAKKNGRELMIGQCLRFAPSYSYVKNIVSEKRYGKILGAFFNRLSTSPTWGWKNWFADPSLSGGAVTDLHIHDLDYVRYVLGEPDAVSARATSSFSIHDTVHTALFYKDFPVTAIADWTHIGTKFRAESYIDFEDATVTFTGNTVSIYNKKDASCENVELESYTGYYGEIAYFCDVVSGKEKNERNTPESAARSIRLVELVKESINASGEITPVRYE